LQKRIHPALRAKSRAQNQESPNSVQALQGELEWQPQRLVVCVAAAGVLLRRWLQSRAIVVMSTVGIIMRSRFVRVSFMLRGVVRMSARMRMAGRGFHQSA
jgi:hypothetical protein